MIITMIRQNSVKKTIMWGEVGDSRKRGRPNTRWIDALKEATTLDLPDLSRDANGKTF